MPKTSKRMSESRARVIAARDLVEATRAAKMGLAYEGMPLVVMTSDGRPFVVGGLYLAEYSHHTRATASSVSTEVKLVGTLTDRETDRMVRLVARTSKLRLGKRGKR